MNWNSYLASFDIIGTWITVRVEVRWHPTAGAVKLYVRKGHGSLDLVADGVGDTTNGDVSSSRMTYPKWGLYSNHTGYLTQAKAWYDPAREKRMAAMFTGFRYGVRS